MARKTIGDYLREPEPPFALWKDVLDVVFARVSNEPCLEAIGETARAVYLVRMFGGELSNGGFHQFLTNSSGAHAQETLEALRRIGATFSSGLLEQALSLFPAGKVPKDQHERIKLLFPIAGRVKELLDDLDRRAYRDIVPVEGGGRESLDGLLLVYMQTRAADGVIAEPGN